MTFIKKHVKICVGIVLVIAGLILMPVPGPGGTPVFLAGLALLATEFKWARNFLEKFKASYAGMSKRRRRILTVSLLAFYIASSVLAYKLFF